MPGPRECREMNREQRWVLKQPLAVEEPTQMYSTQRISKSYSMGFGSADPSKACDSTFTINHSQSRFNGGGQSYFLASEMVSDRFHLLSEDKLASSLSRWVV